MAAIKSLKSTHGRQLLNALSEWTVVSNDGCNTSPIHSQVAENIRGIVMKDTLATRLAESETGNNAFHLLVSKPRLSPEIIIQFLQILSLSGSEGLKKVNKDGDCPLHLYLLQSRVSADVVQCLITLAPSTVNCSNGQSLIPLFLCVMRDDISSEVVKLLCKAYPAGPSTCNATNSLPLHFAAKKVRPNKEILKILLRRHPGGAGHINDYGLLPLHCAAAFADDLEAVSMILDANPSGIIVPDRQGRLPLHLAVLAVGSSHSQALQAENEEALLQQRMEALSMKDSSTAAAVSEDIQEEDFDEDAPFKSGAVPNLWPFQEVGQRSRRVVYFLARSCPITLCMRNNFEAVPVDTVLSKVKPERTKRKIVCVYGLYDDPITARWLLVLHRESIRHTWKIYGNVSTEFLCEDRRVKRMPAMIGRHVEELCELNWVARKPALLASYQGQCLLSKAHVFTATNSSVSKKNSAGSKSKQSASTSTSTQTIGGNAEGFVHAHNLLGRLRNQGVVELVRYVFQYI